ncbi:MAG: SDR family NAD(P)-dependent oxidoreductase [Legionella sp.]|nr:SDR family NAD(P)-dependent oxidoreductase [Legionella sp.]
MKVTVITGAASGIGLALSTICLQRGSFVIMVDKNHDSLLNKADELKIQFPNHVLAIPCDVTNSSEVNQLAKKSYNQFGRIDYIYNNAGIIGTLSPVWDLTSEQIHQVMDVNLYGMIHLIREFTPFLFKQSFRSHIINMASMYALCSGAQLASYSMSKHAVLALSESLHYDLNRLEKPVDVSIVFPSFTDTSLLSYGTESDFHEALNKLLAHSRSPEDVATHIVNEVEKKRFYILPDREVKDYCDARTRSIIMQEQPHINNIEKLMSSLVKRKKKNPAQY